MTKQQREIDAQLAAIAKRSNELGRTLSAREIAEIVEKQKEENHDTRS